MQFSKFLVAAAAFAVAQAQVMFTDPAGSFSEITAGKSFNFTWSGAAGPVTLTLKNGGANNLQTVSTIASGLTGTSYIWSVPSSLTADTYAVTISDGATTNYSPQFQLIGGASSTSSAASSTSTGSSSTGSSSSGSSTTSTGSSSSSSATTTGSSTSSASKTSSTGSSSTGSKTTSSTGAATSTTAPSSASGLSSPLAFVLLALAAFFTLN